MGYLNCDARYHWFWHYLDYFGLPISMMRRDNLLYFTVQKVEAAFGRMMGCRCEDILLV